MTKLYFVCAIILVAHLCVATAHRTQDLHEKDAHKKDKDKKDYHRYEDWGLDWSDADMMQHTIDEAPRRVSVGGRGPR